MNPAEIEALFAQTFVEGYDDDEPWEAVRKLRTNGSREIFNRAAAWCESEDPKKRARGVDVLCQLHHPRPPDTPVAETEWLFRDKSSSLVAKVLSVGGLLKLSGDPDDDVCDWAVFGLGVQGDADSSEIREALLQRLEDANEDVREEAVLGLDKTTGSTRAPGAPDHARGIRSLSEDETR